MKLGTCDVMTHDSMHGKSGMWRRNNMWTLHFSKELQSHLGLGMLVLPKVKHIIFLKHVRVWVIHLSIVIIFNWKLWISLNMKLGSEIPRRYTRELLF